MWDELPTAEEKRRRDFRRWGRFVTEASAATGTLLLTATVFGVSSFFALRGSEMVVLPPEQVLLYRNGSGDSAVLSVAMPSRVINLASQDHGDVVERVSLHVSPRKGKTSAAFRYDMTVQNMTATSPAQAEAQAAECRLGVRCLARGVLVIQEEPVKLLNFPGGVGRSETLGFVLFPPYCSGSPQQCARFGSFAQSVSLLRRDPDLGFALALDFHGDDDRIATCSLADLSAADRKAAFDFLEEDGWAQLECDRKERRGS